MSGETTRLTEPQLRELAARGAAELDGATATDMLRWTDETFGDIGGAGGGVSGHRGWTTCNYVVASNMADAVLVDLAAKVRPGVPVIFLDTGYHFVETIGTRDAIESVYDVRVLNVTPSTQWPSRTNCWARTCSPATPMNAAGCARSFPWARRCVATPRG